MLHEKLILYAVRKVENGLQNNSIKIYSCTLQMPPEKLLLQPDFARVVELVDTRVSKTRAARRAGSIPAPGTKNHASVHGFFYVCRKKGFRAKTKSANPRRPSVPDCRPKIQSSVQGFCFKLLKDS